MTELVLDIGEAFTSAYQEARVCVTHDMDAKHPETSSMQAPTKHPPDGVFVAIVAIAVEDYLRHHSTCLRFVLLTLF